MGTMQIESFRIAQFGPRLGTRMEGVRAREQLVSLLGSLPDEGQVRVSLQGLDVLSTSFADELIGKTLQRLTDGGFGNRTMILVTPSLELADGIDAKLTQRQLAMICLVDDSWHLVGAYTQAIHETLSRIIDRQQTTAKELALDLGLQMNACVNRVARLAKLHLIRRVQIGMSGPQAIYTVHSILPR
jgi:uncharacterized protein YidB (DUF937 family)